MNNTTLNSYDSLLRVLYNQNKLTEYANLAHDASYEYYFKKDYPKAIKYALEEVKYKKHLSVEKQKNSLFNLGLFFFKNEEYSKSIDTYNLVTDSFSVDEKTYRAYCENAKNYQKLGDYYHAKNYFRKGLARPEQISTKRLPLIYLNNITLNQVIESKETLKENAILLNKVDSLSNIITLKPGDYYSLLNEYGIYYSSPSPTYNFEKSKYYHLKALKTSIGNNDSLRIVASSNNIAKLLNLEKKDSALYYINKAITFAKKEDTNLAKLYLNRADFFNNKNKLHEALKSLNTALQLTLPSEIDTSYTSTPDLKLLKLSNNKILTILILKEKARYILENVTHSKNKELLNIAYKNIIVIDKLLDIVRLESSEKESKLFWQKEASQVYALGVDACYKLEKPNTAFYFIEKNKALLLLENIVKNNTQNRSVVPVSVLQKDLDFKKRIYALENKMSISSNTLLQDKYYSLKIKYRAFVKTLEKVYPGHYKLSQPLDLINLKTVKNNLTDGRVILEYILGEKNSYVLFISKEKTLLKKLSTNEPLGLSINKYLKLISKPFNNNFDLEECRATSKNLYATLFPFEIDSILKKNDQLLIIPDQTLQNLPFESLNKDHKYLIEDFEISYAYSLTFLNSNKSIKRDAPHSFIGFAPESFNYDHLQTLPRSKIETTTIGNQLDGLVLLDDSATKEHFFSKAKDYKIIHLSTHANANDSIAPWIAFKNEKLYLNELYTTKNQAELVVLNACNSSLGEMNAGEGVFSLARGFFYSGANSVVSSLWNVNDKSNSEITTNFYRYLKEGKTKSSSLRQAKLDYIHTHSLSDVSPYYWSSLILIGDATAIYTSYNVLFYIALALLFIAILFFIIKKIKFVGNNS
ncbi:CHAT domain-containing protein [Lacinutrix neustonica]|uniref:CHAT domain-containing protein n=1 Tax=Lacinutrix neustonica TaxID=2980107 RepID=A0A9E8N0H7_9FLAO|nr:CHAT domain-containing protein [Lacinutrix neustonica]WAC03629.1 CHAT domain-containing protein [Lacinutrix neustonica]